MVRVRVSVKVSVSIINVYVEHRYLSVLHCISQRNGMDYGELIRVKSLLIAYDRTGREFPRGPATVATAAVAVPALTAAIAAGTATAAVIVVVCRYP